jgi:hypothetical protein
VARFFLPITFAILFLSGCVAVVPTVTDGNLDGPGSNYSRAVADRILGAGPVPTEIHGNPSNLERSAFERLVLERLRAPAVWGTSRFGPSSDSQVDHSYRLVLVFNPKLDGANSPAGQPVAKSDSPARYDLAMCRGDIVVSEGAPYPPLPLNRLESVRSRRLSPISPRLLEERLLIRGALCLGDVPISASFVEVQRLEDYAEPEFDQLLGHLLLRIMPYREPLPACREEGRASCPQ